MSWPDFDEQLQNNSAMMTANRITARAPFQPVQIDSFVVFTLFGCLVNILLNNYPNLLIQERSRLTTFAMLVCYLDNCRL